MRRRRREEGRVGEEERRGLRREQPKRLQKV
jgi:hypothetical protein